MGAINAVLAAAVLAAAVAFVVLASSLSNRYPLLLGYAVASFAIVEWEVPSTSPLLTVSGVAVKPEDAVFILLVAATLSRPQVLVQRVRRVPLPFVVLILCGAASLTAGVLRYGPAAVNEAREFLWSAALVVWVLNQDFSNQRARRATESFLVFVASALAVVFAYHLFRYGLGTADSFVVTDTGVERTGRPLTSSQAILLTGISLYLLASRSPRTIGHWALASSLLVIAVLCQHRSVWLAICAGLALLIITSRGSQLAGLLAFGFYGIVVVLLCVGTGLVAPVVDDIAYGLTSEGTLDARVDTWAVLVGDSVARGASSMMFGEPFGFGYVRTSSAGEMLTFPPHNWYVSVYLRLGLIGLTAFVSLLVAGLLVLRRTRNAVGGVLAATMITYMWFYALPWYLPVLLLVMTPSRLESGNLSLAVSDQDARAAHVPLLSGGSSTVRGKRRAAFNAS